jgi:hypothetical protein
MKVLDLFCGQGGWSKAFHEAGHECTGLDLVDLGYPYRFIKADFEDWKPDQYYDIILASPPCNHFSKVNQNWNGKNNNTKGLDLVWRTFALIQEMKPKYWIIENVKGLAEFIDKPDDVVRYGHSVHRKSAYLWSNIGKLGFFSHMIVKNTNRHTFKHPKGKRERTLHDGPRGSSSLAVIPYPLSQAVLEKIKEKEKAAQKEKEN